MGYLTHSAERVHSLHSGDDIEGFVEWRLFAAVTVVRKQLGWKENFQLNGCHLLKVPQPSQIELTARDPFQTHVPVRESSQALPSHLWLLSSE